MPTAADGLAATVISQTATDQAIADREGPSKVHPSTMQESIGSKVEAALSVPADRCELDETLDR